MDYWRGLNAVWDTDKTIVNVEHDMECSDELVRQLVECDQPACSHAYRVWLSDRYKFVYAAHSPGIGWLREGTPAAHYCGIGFCKIEPSARTRPLNPGQWLTMEQAVNLSVAEWHLHWPAVDHHHSYDIDPTAIELQVSGSVGGEVVFRYGEMV